MRLLSMKILEHSDFLRLSEFVHNNYGIDLSKKKTLVESRLSNSPSLVTFGSFSDYIDYIITKKDPQEMEDLLNKLTTNYTYFMRESEHFDYFRDHILPELITKRKDKVLSVWSAGCSSGEEPYTLSMIIFDVLGAKAKDWDTRILATDISQSVLSKAQLGVYSSNSLENLPESWKNQYFVKDGLNYTVAPLIKSNVIFQTFNLMSPIKFRMKFDVIFCRNVMIYFDHATKHALVQRFFEATNPGGHLLVGHSEALSKENNPYDFVRAATYKKI